MEYFWFGHKQSKNRLFFGRIEKGVVFFCAGSKAEETRSIFCWCFAGSKKKEEKGNNFFTVYKKQREGCLFYFWFEQRKKKETPREYLVGCTGKKSYQEEIVAQ